MQKVLKSNTSVGLDIAQLFVRDVFKPFLAQHYPVVRWWRTPTRIINEIVTGGETSETKLASMYEKGTSTTIWRTRDRISFLQVADRQAMWCNQRLVAATTHRPLNISGIGNPFEWACGRTSTASSRRCTYLCNGIRHGSDNQQTNIHLDVQRLSVCN